MRLNDDAKAGVPPFIVQRATILRVDDADPRKMEQAYQFKILNEQENVRGYRIRFPRTGFEAALVESGRSAFSVTDAPAAGQVVKGAPFVVYAIQAGDRPAGLAGRVLRYILVVYR